MSNATPTEILLVSIPFSAKAWERWRQAALTEFGRDVEKRRGNIPWWESLRVVSDDDPAPFLAQYDPSIRELTVEQAFREIKDKTERGETILRIAMGVGVSLDLV